MQNNLDKHAPLLPLLKWAGGKRWQIPFLLPLWRRHENRRLVEPFCGGLAVALGLRPARALLNDSNPHLINFYRWVTRDMIIRLRMENARERFDACRRRFNRLATNGGRDCVKAAELFYYLNRTAFNGLCRFNSSGCFNVPFGKYKTITYQRRFADHGEAMRDWEFTSMDFAEVLIEPDDFIYSDSPYAEIYRSQQSTTFVTYGERRFTWEDQERLASWLAAHPGPVVATNHATKEICRLYGSLGFKLRYLDGPRRISCTGDRTPAREMFATRNM